MKIFFLVAIFSITFFWGIFKSVIISPLFFTKFLNKYNFKEGDSVRLIDSKSVGIIEKLEKNKVIINYGSFKTKTTTDELEIV